MILRVLLDFVWGQLQKFLYDYFFVQRTLLILERFFRKFLQSFREKFLQYLYGNSCRFFLGTSRNCSGMPPGISPNIPVGFRPDSPLRISFWISPFFSGIPSKMPLQKSQKVSAVIPSIIFPEISLLMRDYVIVVFSKLGPENDFYEDLLKAN